MSARHGDVASANQPHIGDRVMRSATRARRDRGAGPGEVGDAGDAGGVEGFGESHRRQDGGEPARQPRLARSRTAQHQEIMLRTPA
jgi:hypothetical protein